MDCFRRVRPSSSELASVTSPKSSSMASLSRGRKFVMSLKRLLSGPFFGLQETFRKRSTTWGPVIDGNLSGGNWLGLVSHLMDYKLSGNSCGLDVSWVTLHNVVEHKTVDLYRTLRHSSRCSQFCWYVLCLNARASCRTVWTLWTTWWREPTSCRGWTREFLGVPRTSSTWVNWCVSYCCKFVAACVNLFVTDVNLSCLWSKFVLTVVELSHLLYIYYNSYEL